MDTLDVFDDTENAMGATSMTTGEAAIHDLRQVARELEARGDDQLARRLDSVIVALVDEKAAEPPLMTTGAAARELGINSVNTIKRWTSQGLLEGFRRGGRVLVSRSSVEKLKSSKSLSEQVAFECELAEALDPFDVADEPAPDLSATWDGRKPWEHDAGTGRTSVSR